jgi:endo-1,4-beta-xylanase
MKIFNNLIIIGFSIQLIFPISGCSKKDGPQEDGSPDLTLRSKAFFGIGAAVKTDQLKESQFSYTLNKHFSQITAEWEMKMESIWSSSTQFNWSKADQLVEYAENNGLDVHGHTLVWYKSFPNWFKNAAYDSAAFENHVKDYIEATVGRYKGKVASWDVVNEVFNDNGTLRSEDCPVYATFKDPIAFYGRCFEYARQADPEAKLFYNDYNIFLASGKRNSVKMMVERFKEEGYPIDGIGEQSHCKITTDMTAMRNGLKDLATTGLLIHISELDVIVNTGRSDSYVFIDSDKIKQSQMYGNIVEMYETLPDNQKFAITTWGVTDKYTWLTDWWHPREYPLLFDENYQPKRAYQAFLESLK